LWVSVVALVLIACLSAAAAVAARRAPVPIVRRVPGIARREHGEKPVAVWPPAEADHARRAAVAASHGPRDRTAERGQADAHTQGRRTQIRVAARPAGGAAAAAGGGGGAR